MKLIVTKLFILMLVFNLCFGQIANSQADTISWNSMSDILLDIKEPKFLDKQYFITDYGAIANDTASVTQSIQKAINDCSKNGGGQVVIPPGTFYTAAIHLKSNVDLHLSEGSQLKFSTRPSDYLPVVLSRWEGVDCYNYSPLIYAYQQENIAISGKGSLDGQASEFNWWPWKGLPKYGWKDGMESQLIPEGRDKLLSFEANKIPVENRAMGDGHFLRPPFIQFYQCKNILLQDFSIYNAPCWIIHPLLSENITARRLTIESYGPNNDGLDPESCKNVLIEDCFFSTGDDCIAIKSGRNNDGRRWNIPSENIIVRNCRMSNGHGGVVIGSEISGGCRNVFVTDCIMNSAELDRAIRIKTNVLRGGIIENIFVKNIEVGEVKEAILRIHCTYETELTEGEFMPVVRNIYLSNITSNKSKYPIYIEGLPNNHSVYNIRITNSNFNGASKENRIQWVTDLKMENVTINGNDYNMVLE